MYASVGGEQTNRGAAVVQIVECVRHAAELPLERQGLGRVQSVHYSSSAEQVGCVHQAGSSRSSTGGERLVVEPQSYR